MAAAWALDGATQLIAVPRPYRNTALGRLGSASGWWMDLDSATVATCSELWVGLESAVIAAKTGNAGWSDSAVEFAVVAAVHWCHN